MEAKLTVELVPSTAWYSNVRTMVSKQVWDILRREAYKKAGYRCEVCGGKGNKHPVECHEIWHYDDKEHIQKLLGLIALCPSCHEVKHLGFATVQGRDEIAKQHLAKVNGWTEIQVDKYVTKQFEKWRERSKHQWKLNLEWLEKRGFYSK